MKSILYAPALTPALALALAACGGGDDAADYAGADVTVDDSGAVRGEMVEESWAANIRATCLADAGEAMAEQCDCLATTLTEGRSAQEIVNTTDEERQAAAEACQ